MVLEPALKRMRSFCTYFIAVILPRAKILAGDRRAIGVQIEVTFNFIVQLPSDSIKV